MNVRSIIDAVFVQSWWVFASILLCAILYERGIKEKELIYRQLTHQMVELEKEKREALRQQKNLQLQIDSQSDLAWMELTLMRELGLVPEDQIKVYLP